MPKVHWEPYQIYKMACFVEIVNNGFQLLTIFAKHSTLDVWQGSVYAFVSCLQHS